MLKLCRTTELLIANGRLGHDANLGEYTFIGDRGRSVVDYLLTLCDFLDSIVNFRICSPTEFSDHSALSFKLNCHVNSVENYDNEYSTFKKLRWKCDKTETFRQTLSANVDCYNEVYSVLDDAITCDCR